MEQYGIFSILNKVDSTNNYAMAQAREGLAKHGMAWFATHQTGGKGQRGKTWEAAPGENILMSIAIEPPETMRPIHFTFNAAIALVCISFLQSLTGESFRIKWPNDIYWRDRKAGGILIENIIHGSKWKWSVAGIGINVNQSIFPEAIKNPVSINLITNKHYDVVSLAKKLHLEIMNKINHLNVTDTQEIMSEYNKHLYKINEEVKLRKANVIFTTRIKEIDASGNLLTSDVIERSFSFGEVEWIIS